MNKGKMIDLRLKIRARKAHLSFGNEKIELYGYEEDEIHLAMAKPLLMEEQKSINMTIEKIGRLKVQRIGELKVDGSSKNKTLKDKSFQVPLKRTIRHLAGTSLTKEQLKINKKLGGMNQTFYINQIIMLLENNLFNFEDDSAIEMLIHLGDLINDIKKKKDKKSA